MENKKRNQILLVLFLGVLMGALDIAIVGPALPAIRSSFAVTERSLAWIFSIYVLFNLIGTPLMSKLSDQFGRRWIYILDITLFAIGSLIVGLSNSFPLVLVGRAIQGFGAGGIFPVASAVIGDTFPPEKRGGALGLIGAVFGLAFLIGPLLGALILNVASWHWLFFINLPVAVLIAVLSLRLLPSVRTPNAGSFDFTGMAVLAAMLASLAYGINRIDTASFLTSLISWQVWPFLAVAVILFFILGRIERSAANPVVSPAVFDRRQLKLAYFLSAGAGFGEASLVFMPLLAVVAIAGITTRSASWMLIPVVLAMVIGSPTSGRLLDRYGSKLVIVSGTAVMVAGLFVLSLFASSLVGFIIAGFLIGLGLSALLGAPIRYITLNEASASERSVAQGVVALFGSVGQLLGSVLVGAVAASGAAQNPAAGYTNAFLVVAVVSLILLGVSFLLKNRAQELETVSANTASATAQTIPAK
jgi:EmrB/QacA subfamily drug resistance transporter